MCGRTACNLAPGLLVRACTFRGQGAGVKGNTRATASKENIHGGKEDIPRVKGNILGAKGNILGAKEAPSSTARATPEIVDFGDEDDSFLLAATIPPVDPFTPQHHTAFLYSAPKLPKQEEEVEDCFDEDDNIESFLLEASINVESEATSEKLGIKSSKEDVQPDEEDSGTFPLDASLRDSAEMKVPKDDISEDICGDFCPVWRDAPCGGRYRPSPNLPPTLYATRLAP